MDPQIHKLFNEALLASALERFGAAPHQAKILDGFENFIYEYDSPQGERILRISHTSRRSADMIMGEVDWLNHLVANGVSAAQVIPSLAGRMAEVFPDGALPAPDKHDEYFCAVSFVKAPGHTVGKDEWIPPLWTVLGRLVGRMNFLARTYQPPEERFRRPDWRQEQNDFADRYLPPSEADVVQVYHQALDELGCLLRTPDDYGLVHQDVHRGNFLLDGDRITLFDFDDLQYSWFAYDIAMALYYALPPDAGPKDAAYARHFLDCFLEGYFRENALDSRWLAEIPRFLKMRELELYVAIHRSYDLDHLDPWCQRFMNGRRERILNHVPFVEMNF